MLYLSEKIPLEGTVGIDPIIEMIKGGLGHNVHQATITTDLIPEEHLQNVIHQAQENDEEYGLYIVEHHGHFILLNLQQTPTGVEYSIYDSLLHNPSGPARREAIEEILRNTFFNAVITHNPNKYIRVRQGEDPFHTFDASNCGLTAIFAQFIFDQFEDFPIYAFINDPALYTRLNAIAQNMRGRQIIDFDTVMQELTFLALEIAENPENFQYQEPEEPFDILQEIENIAAIGKSYPDEQETELLYILTPKIANLLKKTLGNKDQVDKDSLNLIVEFYKMTIEMFAKHRESFLARLNDLFSRVVSDALTTSSGPLDGRAELSKEIELSDSLINTFYFFHELKKRLSRDLFENHEDLFEIMGVYDPIIWISQLVRDVYLAEVIAVGDRIDIKILKDFDQAIALALKLAKENEEAYLQSDREEIRLMIPHLNNQLLRYNLSRSTIGSGPTAIIDEEKMARAFAKYAANVQEAERNDHNIMGLLMDYAMNGTRESFMKFRSTLVAIQDDAKKLQYLQMATQTLIGEASKRVKNFKEEAIERFEKIHYLLTGEGLTHFTDQDPELKFALTLIKQSLYATNEEGQKHKYKAVPEEEVLATDPSQLSGFYSELYLTSISLTQNLEKAREVILAHLDRESAPHCPTQEALDFYNLQAAFSFRDYFVYNEACPQYNFANPEAQADQVNQAFTAAIEIHEKAIKKTQTPEFKLSLLNSLFKLHILSLNHEQSEATIQRIIALNDQYQRLDKKININAYRKYLNATQSDQELTTEQRVDLIKDIDEFLIMDVEHDLMIQRENELMMQQYLKACQEFKSQAAPARPKKPEKEYVLKIDGSEVDLNSLPTVTNDAGTQYKIHCPDELLNKTSNNEEKFKAALAKTEFAKAKGDDGTKFICQNKNGTVYELKIKGSEARILGILTEFKDPSGNTVRLIHFSKYLSTTKDSSGRTNTQYNNAKDSLKPPTITYEERTPGTALASAAASAAAPPKHKQTRQ